MCGELPPSFVEKLLFDAAKATVLQARLSVVNTLKELACQVLVSWSKDKRDVRLFRKTKQEDPSPCCQWEPASLLKTALHLKFKCLVERVRDCFAALHLERKRERARQKAYERHLAQQEATRAEGQAQLGREKRKGRGAWSHAKVAVHMAADVSTQASEALGTKLANERGKGKAVWGKIAGRAGVGSFTSNIWHEQVWRPLVPPVMSPA